MQLEAIKSKTLSLIFHYSIPSIIAMVLSSFITIVDGIFITNFVGEKALAAVNLGVPMLYIFLAFTLMIGIGGVSQAGIRLGAKEIDKSINGFNQTMLTAGIGFILLAIIMYGGLYLLIDHVGIQVATQNMIKSYYRIIIPVYPFMMMNIVMGMFVRCEGKPYIFMLNTIITTLLNIILDYVFMVKLGQGISGAAWASGISVLVGTVILTSYFISSKSLFKFKKFTFISADFYKSLANGSSELIGHLAMSITTFMMNGMILGKLGLSGVAAMTIIGYTYYVFNMIVLGFGQGISPMISFSYGAQELEVCMKLRQYTHRIVTGLGVVFYVIFAMGSGLYAIAFTNDPHLIAMISGGLKWFSLAFLVAGFNVIASFYFTAMGRAKESAIISSLRGLVLLIINIYVLPSIFGSTGIWLIAPITEIGTCMITLYLLLQTSRKSLLLQSQ